MAGTLPGQAPAGRYPARGARALPVQEAANLVGVGMGELVEDGERLLPVLAGAARFAPGPAGLADAGQQRGLPVAVAEVAEQVQGIPVAGERPVVVAEAVVGVAE